MASRVCIITSEFVGLYRNGGIGTAYTNLAMLLASAGHEVTVAYVGAQEGGPEMMRRWRAHYAAHGINLIVVKLELGVTLGNAPWSRAMSYKIYAWLRQQATQFDTIHVAMLATTAIISATISHWGGLSFMGDSGGLRKQSATNVRRGHCRNLSDEARRGQAVGGVLFGNMLGGLPASTGASAPSGLLFADQLIRDPWDELGIESAVEPVA